MGYVIAFFQKNPKAKAQAEAVFSLEADGIVWVTTARGKQQLKSASLVADNNHVLLADSDQFLREMARQSLPSCYSYEYTENTDRVAEYLDLILGTRQPI